MLHTSEDISRCSMLMVVVSFESMQIAVNTWYYLKTKLTINRSIPEAHTGKIIVHTIDKIG